MPTLPTQTRSQDALDTDRIRTLEAALRRAQEDIQALRPQLALLPHKQHVDQSSARITQALQR